MSHPGGDITCRDGEIGRETSRQADRRIYSVHAGGDFFPQRVLTRSLSSLVG